jgi:RNA polymerase sigma factor (sigma-70 family)
MTIEQTTLSELVRECEQATRRYRQQNVSDPRYCLEIFRRAVRKASNGMAFLDEEARNALVIIYSEYIKAQINRRFVRELSLDDLVQQAWLRFWQAALNSQLEFPSLGSALNYLQTVTVSVVIEALKQQSRQQNEQYMSALVRGGDDEALRATTPQSTPFDQLVRQRFRERCREVIADPLEYKIFWLRFGLGLAPRHIATMLADEGVHLNQRVPTARLVSDSIFNSRNRLSQDREIRDLLSGD